MENREYIWEMHNTSLVHPKPILFILWLYSLLLAACAWPRGTSPNLSFSSSISFNLIKMYFWILAQVVGLLMWWSDSGHEYVGACKALPLMSTARVWVAWDLPDSNRKNIHQLSRSLRTGSCTERSEPLKSYLFNLSDEASQAMHHQNINLSLMRLELKGLGKMAGQVGTEEMAVAAAVRWGEIKWSKVLESVCPHIVPAAVYTVVR